MGAHEEPHVDVGFEDVNVRERRVFDARDRTAVMYHFANIVSAGPHHIEPVLRDGTQFSRLAFQPDIDGRIPIENTVNPKYPVHNDSPHKTWNQSTGYDVYTQDVVSQSNNGG